MDAKLRSRLSYANVMATIAVFVALGGSGYAAARINGKLITDGTIAGKKLKRDTLGSRQIRESRLSKPIFGEGGAGVNSPSGGHATTLRNTSLSRLRQILTRRPNGCGPGRSDHGPELPRM